MSPIVCFLVGIVSVQPHYYLCVFIRFRVTSLQHWVVNLSDHHVVLVLILIACMLSLP